MADTTNAQLTSSHANNNQMSNLEPTTMQVQMTVQQCIGSDTQPQMGFISINEYNALKRDNESLRAQIIELNNKRIDDIKELNNKYIDEIKIDKATIEALRAENINLKKQLKDIEAELANTKAELATTNAELATTNAELATTNAKLEKNNTDLHELQSYMYNQQLKEQANNILFAIQDVNSYKQLEKNATDPNIKRLLEAIHINRNGTAHYINITFDIDKHIKDYKMCKLLEHLKTVNSAVKRKFNKVIGYCDDADTLDKIITVLDNECKTIVIPDVSPFTKSQVLSYFEV